MLYIESMQNVMKWNKAEAGVWETTDRSYRAESHYNGFLSSTRWALYTQTPGAKSWMRDERTLLATLATLRDCKVIVQDLTTK